MRLFHFLVISLALEPKDCLVSEWSGWAGCSKTCGIGETVRGFTIIDNNALQCFIVTSGEDEDSDPAASARGPSLPITPGLQVVRQRPELQTR